MQIGAAVNAPTEFCAIPAVRYVQDGSAASASSVRQTPPPETPTQNRQLPGVQVGAITIAVTRLAVAFVAPVQVCVNLKDGHRAIFLEPIKKWDGHGIIAPEQNWNSSDLEDRARSGCARA